MRNAQPAQPQPGFDAGPLLNMYLSSLDAWKKNYDVLVHVPDEQPRLVKASDKIIASYDKATVQAQRTGNDIFRRAVEQQIELCRFFGKRWEHYLDLPSDFARCKSAVDIAQLQLAFLTKMATDYGMAGRHLVEDLQELASNGMKA